MVTRSLAFVTLITLFAIAGSVRAQQLFGNRSSGDPDQEARFAKFEESMNGAVLEGQFTIVGKPADKPATEEYTIKSVKKLPTGDYWLFQARIKYGDKDLTLPVPIEVKWAGETPVITLSDTTIPGLGTFGARVVIDRDKYAGTWSHDEVGGHMFGVIKREPPSAEEDTE